MMFGKDKMKGKMSENSKKAKLVALKEAHGMAKKMMEDDLKGLKKVTVASDSPEGLKAGLEKAEDMIGEETEGCPACEGKGCEECESGMGESDEDEQEEYKDQQEESEPMDIDSLEAKIAELMKMKEKLQK